MACAQTSEQPRPARAQNPDAFDARDLSGKWVRISPFQAFSNVPGGIPLGGANLIEQIKKGLGTQEYTNGGQFVEEAPFTAEGKKRFEANSPSYGRRMKAPYLGNNDPQGMCDPLGIPRNLNVEVAGPHKTMEIVQAPGRMLQFFPWHHDWREVWTDGRALPKTDDLEPKWDGYSVGHWDENTFVVESIGFDERTWLDQDGYPHSEEMKLTEHWRRLDANTLELVMTLEDPVVYSRPWNSDTKIFRLDREGVKDWDPQIYCVPSEEFKFNKLIRDGGVGKSGK